MIGSPNHLTSLVPRSHPFGVSFSTNNDTTSLQPFISYLCVRQKIICKQCGMIGHKDDSCIFCGPNFLSPSLRINRNKSNALYGDEPAEPPREWNNQPPVVHIKYHTRHCKTSHVVLDIMGRLNHRVVDNGVVDL